MLLVNSMYKKYIQQAITNHADTVQLNRKKKSGILTRGESACKYLLVKIFDNNTENKT